MMIERTRFLKHFNADFDLLRPARPLDPEGFSRSTPDELDGTIFRAALTISNPRTISFRDDAFGFSLWAIGSSRGSLARLPEPLRTGFI